MINDLRVGVSRVWIDHQHASGRVICPLPAPRNASFDDAGVSFLSVSAGTAVQINVYPMDVRHVEHLLPHHVRTWGGVVDRIVLTLDIHRSRAGRYRGSNYDASLAALRKLIAKAQSTYPGLEVQEVDYSLEARKEVANYFFGTDTIPVKAWDGGPFYAYFYGLYSARARYIVHFDGDMLFGGGSQHWLAEAIALLERRPDVLIANPFPGPPRSDGAVFGHRQKYSDPEIREPGPALAYRFNHVSTRIFLIDMQRFKERLGVLPSITPSYMQRLKAKMLGNPPDALEAEVVLSHALAKSGLHRVDFLGEPPGLWGLHPPYRSEEFYRRLPEIVARVESGDVPDGQRGHYDLNDSIIDWTDARAASRWYRRYKRLLADRLVQPT